MEVTKKALYKGMEQARHGNRLGDIGHAIQTYAEGEGFSVVRDFTGHGIGPTIHEESICSSLSVERERVTLKRRYDNHH